MTTKLWFVLAAAQVLLAGNAATVDVSWVPDKPEVLTYRATSGDAGNSLYQVAIAKGQSTIETNIDIIAPGFMKVVSGSMTLEMVPLRSISKILVGDQIQMDTEATYGGGKVKISTAIKPFNRTVSAEVAYSSQVVDFAQIPFLLRMLPLQKDAQFEFSSLNPRSNKLVPFRAKVTGEGPALGVDSYRVECEDFEGQSIYWIEKAGHHRVLRIEQPAQHRTTELIL